MFTSWKPSVSPFSLLFRVLITAVFLFGLLPIPVLAVDNGTIAGQVTDSETSNHISGVSISVFASGSESPSWFGDTDGSGNYTIAVPEGNDYQLTAFKEGYVTGQTGGQNVTSNATTTVDFSLDPGGIIQGTVSDNTSNPVQNASVRAYLPASAGTFYSSQPTDASGHFSLTVPPGGGYTVEADKQDIGSANQTSVPAALETPRTVDLTIAPPPEQPPQDSTPPADITDLATGNVTPDSVNLTWTAPGDDGSTGQAAEYDIRLSTSAISDNSSFDSATPLPDTPPPQSAGGTETIMIPGLSANVTYFFAVKARDDADLWSGLSNSPSATTSTEQQQPPPQDSTPPADITDLATGNVTHESVVLTWTAPGDDGSTGQAAEYDIRLSTSAISDNSSFDSATPLPDTPPPQSAGGTETIMIPGLSANVTYFFAVKARDDADRWSGLSNPLSVNTSTPPLTPYFTVTHSQGKSSFMLAAGDNITETIDVTSVNGFEGTIDFGIGGPPEIENYSSLTPEQITLTANQTQTITLVIGTAPSMPAGTYQCGLEGQTSAYGGQQKGFFYTVIIGVPGQPLLSASPPVIAADSQTEFFASQFPAGDNITLKWDSGPSAGETIAEGQTSGEGTWTFQVNVPPDMPGGNFAVKAVSGQATAICEITVTSGSDQDFLMSTSPEFISIVPGQSANITVYVSSVNEFNAAVLLATSTAPGVTCNLSASSVTPAGGDTSSAILTITVAEWASPDMYQINIEGSCSDPSIEKVTSLNLDIQPPAEWGPGISLSQSYAASGDTITITGSNFPPECNGENVTIMEAFSGGILQTTPTTIAVENGGFTGTFTVPSEIPSGNYRIKAIVESTGDSAERDFQILATGETFTLGVSPESNTVATEEGGNSSSVSVNLYSIGGNSPTVNLALEGAPNWLTYQFGSLQENTAVSGENAISVPAGASASRNLNLTASMTAPPGNYSITVKAWITDGAEQRVSVELVVQPPADFDMEQFNLSPAYGQAEQLVNFSGSGFTGGTPSQVTELKFGPVDLLTAQDMSTISVPTTGDSAGRLSGTFRVPDLPSGTYFVDLTVGTYPEDIIFTKTFTITSLEDTFVLQASPPFMWAEQGTQINAMIKVQAVGSTSPTVNLSVEGCPSDITASFTSANVTAPPGGIASTELNLNISEWMPTGHYSLTIKGQRAGNDEVHRIPVEIDIAPPAGFGMASIYLSPSSGSTGTWITISGSGFPADTPLTNLFFGPPNAENDQVANGTLPTISTDETGAFSAVFQVPSGLTPGMYPIEVVVGTYPDDRRAMADFTFISDDATFNINVSPMMLQVAPGTPVSTSVNIQSVGTSSANVTLRVKGPPNIEWRFDGGGWQTPTTVSPPIGNTIMSALEIQPKASTSMGRYSLVVKATAGDQTEIRELEVDVGASADYSMPILSLNPNTGTAGTNISFSGSNFPPDTQISGITFGSANISLAQTITTSPTGSFSGAFTVPATVGGQPIAAGTYPVRIYVGQEQADAMFNVYGSDDTFTLTLSPNFLQGEAGGTPVTSGVLKALGGASPTVKMAVKGLPPGVITRWDGNEQSFYTISAPPGGQNNFELTLVLPYMIPMGQYPATLEGWVDTNQNDVWDSDEDITRINLELSVMPPEDYGMGMLSLSPTYGQVGDRITFSGSGFPADTAVTSLIFAQTDVLTANITTADDGSFSGVFTVPDNAFGMPTGPGRYPVDVVVGTDPDDRMGGFDFQVVSTDQKFSVSTSPGWLARPAGDTASVSVSVRSLVTNPPSPNVVLQIEGLPYGVTASFTSANVTPLVGGMEGRELQLSISSSCPMGNYPVSIRAYNAANPSEEMWTEFTLEVTPSSDFMDMGMASITLSRNYGSAGEQITVSGYGFPKSQELTYIRLGPEDVTPASVNTTTDETGAFSAVITIPTIPSGMHPIEVNIQGTIRMIPFNIMSEDATFSLKVSPSWLEPIPAGNPDGRELAITINALPGKTPSVTLSTEGLFTTSGTITQNWNPVSRTVNVTSAGDSTTATLTLIPSENLPPDRYPFSIVAIDGDGNRREYHMEFQVGPPAGFMDTEWMTEQGVFFPDVFLSPKSGPAGTQVNYTGTDLPAGANVTDITFAGNTVPLPAGGITADSTGGFSGSFIVDEAWGLAPGGMYWVDFQMENDTWSQDIGIDFNLTRPDATFRLEANPEWIPPIPPDSYGQTSINVEALGYNSVNVTLAVMEEMNGWGIPGRAEPHWGATDGPSTSNVTILGGGQTSKTFYLKGADPGGYMITIVGWVDSNDNQILDRDIQSEAESEFNIPLDFDVEPPADFKNWDRDTMMQDMDMAEDDMYLFYFPEIVLKPNMGQAGTKVNISATDFPANATVSHLRFAGMELPVPAGTSADENGEFSLVFNVPKTLWNAPTGSGWYDVEVEAQKAGEPPVFIMKPFQVTSADDAFTLKADPNWLPPVPSGDSVSTLIRVKSMSNAANVTLSVDKIPPGINTAFSSNSVNVTPGGSDSATLTLTPTDIPPGHYFAEIKGTATINSVEKTFFTHIEFDIEPSEEYRDWDKDAMMQDMGMAEDDRYLFYFPEIVLSPNMGQAGKKVTITATDFPDGANVTSLRFAGMELPVPAGTAADENGEFTLVFNVPKTLWGGDTSPGWYDIEVEARKPGEPPISIMKPFQVISSDAAFTMRAEPNWLPPIPPGENGSTNILINSTGGAGATVTLTMDKIPPGVDTSFTPGSQVNITPGGSGSATLTLTPTHIPPGEYGAEVKGTATVNGVQKTFFTHVEFVVEPSQEYRNWDKDAMMQDMGMAEDDMYLFYFPEIMLSPNMGQAGNKVTITATDFPDGANVTSLRFAGMELPVPAGTAADENGEFTLVFNAPKTLWGGDTSPGWYDIEVEARKPGEPPISIMKPFQVISSDAAFTMRAEPDWLPPIPPEGSTTYIRIKSTGAGANVTLTMDKIPPGITSSFSESPIYVPPGGSSSSVLTLTPTSIPPEHYGAEIKATATVNGVRKTFYTHIEFEVEPPRGFMDWDRDAMMQDMGMAEDDMYLLYFPEITLNPNVGQAGAKVTISATDFPPGATVTSLRFAGMELPIPTGTTADNTTGNFNLVFNVPKTLWGGDIGSGWYDVEVEAQKAGEPPVFIMKPFQVTSADDAFTLRAEPDWLPPIPPEGSTTTIRVKSTGQAANVTLSVDKIPPGINTSFSTNQVNVSPGDSGSSVLTLTPAGIPPGFYGAEIKATATISGVQKTFYTHVEFDVQPSTMFKDVSWMEQQGIWFPEITLNPTAGPVKTKVSVQATDFPVGAEVTSLRFAGRPLPVPADTIANEDGDFSLVFNVPGDYGIGQYMVEVEASKDGAPPVFIAKPFFVEDSGVTFKLNAVPGFVPGVPQGDSDNTTIFVKSTGQAVTVDLYVDGLPPGVTSTFENATLTVPPGGSSNTELTINTGASTPPGHYPLTIRGVSGGETRMTPFDFGVVSPADFRIPEFILEPDYAPAGYNNKKYKVTFAGTGFPANQSVTNLEFGSQSVAIPSDLTTDANGNFNGVFQMPSGLNPGTYDVRVAVADGEGGYIYDSRPFSIRSDQSKFILKLSPPYLPPLLQGGQGTTIANIRSVSTTAANVTLSVEGLGPGITANFTPSNIVAVSPGDSGSATLTLDVGSSTPPGHYPLSVRGVSGDETVFIPLSFGVMPDIGAGEGHATITINPAQARPDEHIGISGAGFTGGNTVTLTAAPPGAPQAIDITPGDILVQDDGTWATEITVPPASQVPTGSYIIKASDGARASKSPFNIVPATDADFFISVSPQFIDVVQGGSSNTTMNLSSKNGFQEPVVFSVGHLPPGVTATFKNTTGATISKFTGAPGGIREIVAPIEQTPVPGEEMIINVLIDTDADAPLGPYDVALEAGSGTVYRAIPLGFTLISTGANIGISPQSGPSDTDVALSGSGFTAGETVTVTFAGSSIATVPEAITTAQDGSFTAVITVPSMDAGIYPVRVVGNTSGIALERPFSLKPSAVSTFVLYTNPMKVDIPKGRTGTVRAKIEPLGSFQSAVTLNVSGLDAVSGATANISPSATITPSIGTPTTATLTFNVPAGATAGKYPLVVTSTSGSITKTRNVTLNVVPPADTPDFAISLAPNTVPVHPDSSGNTTVTARSINNFSGTVQLSVAMSNPEVSWPSSISYTAGSVTPSPTTGLGKQVVTFTASADAQPGNWTFRITATSGGLSRSTDVMVVCTPAGTTITEYASPRLDPATITSSTPMGMEPPWGDRITINGLINDGAEASVITPSKMDITPDTIGLLPEGASDMLGRITNIDSDSPVDGVEWNLGFPFDPDTLAAADVDEENLKIAYLNPETGTWTEMTTTIDTTNKVAYASPTHFSSWTMIATPTPPSTPSEIVSHVGGGGNPGIISISDSITVSGRVTVDVTATSVDGKVEINIPKGTFAKNRVGQSIHHISMKETTSPGDPPVDSELIGSVYNIGPIDSTFDPPVSLTFSYDESLIPAGATTENLVVATWNDEEWVEMEGSTVDADNNTITVPVSHFSIFTLLARIAPASFEIGALDVSPATVNVGDSVNISASVNNTGDLAGIYEVKLAVNESLAASEEINLSGHNSREVSFTLKPDKAGDYAINIGGMTATLIVNEAPPEAEGEPSPSEIATEPAGTEAAQPEVTPAPAETEPLPSEEPEASAKVEPAVPEASTPETGAEPTRSNEWLILVYVVIAGAIIIGLIYWLTHVRKKAP